MGARLLSDIRDPPVWIRRPNGGVAYVGGGMYACNARPLASLSPPSSAVAGGGGCCSFLYEEVGKRQDGQWGIPA